MPTNHLRLEEAFAKALLRDTQLTQAERFAYWDSYYGTDGTGVPAGGPPVAAE
jgi:hypothetical protein